MKNFKQLFVLLCLVTVLVLPYFVFAQSPLDQLKKVGGEKGAGYADYEDDTFDKVLGGVVQAFLGLLGVIFISLIIYGGYTWMTAGGDEQKIEKAKKTINRAIIGLVVTAGSFAIWQFVSTALLGTA